VSALANTGAGTPATDSTIPWLAVTFAGAALATVAGFGLRYTTRHRR
jgi:hypothetical protein